MNLGAPVVEVEELLVVVSDRFVVWTERLAVVVLASSVVVSTEGRPGLGLGLCANGFCCFCCCWMIMIGRNKKILCSIGKSGGGEFGFCWFLLWSGSNSKRPNRTSRRLTSRAWIMNPLKVKTKTVFDENAWTTPYLSMWFMDVP